MNIKVTNTDLFSFHVVLSVSALNGIVRLIYKIGFHPVAPEPEMLLPIKSFLSGTYRVALLCR